MSARDDDGVARPTAVTCPRQSRRRGPRRGQQPVERSLRRCRACRRSSAPRNPPVRIREPTMPSRSEAPMPSAHSRETIARAGAGTSTTAAPSTTTTSSHPPSLSAETADRNHCPSAASTLGIPYRVPAPAASTTPPTWSDIPTVSLLCAQIGCLRFAYGPYWQYWHLRHAVDRRADQVLSKIPAHVH